MYLLFSDDQLDDSENCPPPKVKVRIYDNDIIFGTIFGFTFVLLVSAKGIETIESMKSKLNTPKL
jgi:hypothetical protein